LKLARCHRSGDLTAVWVPDEDSEALRDLVRQREAAKQDQLRARHRLTKFLLRTGQRPPLGLKAWTEKYVEWVQQVHYTHPAREATLLDCLNEVQHMEQRVKRLEQSILEAVKLAPAPVQAVIQGLQTLRGVAHISAVTIAAELGNISTRFESARKLMGYSGVFPSEDSSGERIRRGSITKSGNAHLRRIVVESAWSYRHRPSIGARLRKRQEGVPAQMIAWKAQNRLYKRYMKLIAAGKDQLGHRGQGRGGFHAAESGMTRTAKTKAKTFQIRKNKDKNTDEQRYPIRGQSQPQPEQARRRILGGHLRQAQPDSRE
jgi:transposase